MDSYENEDPEDRAERLKRAELIRKLEPSAIRAGWVSFIATVGFFTVFGLLFVDFGDPLMPLVPCLVGLLFLVGQIATLVTIWKVFRLKLLRAEVSCWRPVVLAIPGVLISSLIMTVLLGARLA